MNKDEYTAALRSKGYAEVKPGVWTHGGRKAFEDACAEDMNEQRESKQWWAVTGDYGVMRVTGYSCAPTNPDYWWVPSLGSSMSEKFHLFATEPEAIRKALSEVEGKIFGLQNRRDELKAQLAKAT